MRDHTPWSISLGHWGGVQVRLHLFFLLLAAFVLYVSWVSDETQPRNDYLVFGTLSVGILFISVLAHEWAHVWAAQRLGGTVEQIVLWPLGGLATPERWRDPQADLLIQLAGPLTNIGLALLCLPALILQEPQLVLGLLNPLQPGDLTAGGLWLCVWKVTFWINWMLALVNLFPAFPFDGGRILRAAIMYRIGESARERATLIVSYAAQFGALLLLAAAWLMRDETDVSQHIPTWFPLVILAIFLFFSGQHERQKPPPLPDNEDQPFGYDFSQGYTSLERTSDAAAPEDSGPITRWLDERREARLKRQQEIELEEDRRMDELLMRISVQGLQSLSPEERLLLDRVSARYRQRNQHE